MTMQAWQMTGTNEPLVLSEVPEPTIAPGEVRIKVRAAGLCHTDVGILDDPEWADRIGPLPLTLGHEVAGEIIEVATDVEGWSVGDRVGINPAGSSRPGLGRDGGYGKQCVSVPADLVRIPEGVDYVHGALATDAGRAPYRAVIVRGEVKKGDRVGIVGFGGLGQVGARIAVLAGAEVYVAEPKQETWDRARSLGVTAVAADIREFADAQLDVIVDFAGFGTTTAGAIETVRDFGRVVQVGLGRLESTISTKAMVIKQVTLVGSRGGTTADIAAVYEMFADKSLDPLHTTITFDQIPEAIERLRAGSVDGRLVAVYDD